MQLITEHTKDKLEYITETSNTSSVPDVYIQGIFMQSNKVNKNKRFYPKPLMEEAIGKYTKNFIDKGNSIGELDHPSTPHVNLANASHIITSLCWEGDDIIGKAKLLNTNSGNIARGLIESGVKLGVSSRGLGVTKNGSDGVRVLEDYFLNTVDIVHNPSAHGAYVNGIREGVEWIVDPDLGTITQETVENHKKIIEKAPLSAEESRKLFLEFLNSIKL